MLTGRTNKNHSRNMCGWSNAEIEIRPPRQFTYERMHSVMNTITIMRTRRERVKRKINGSLIPISLVPNTLWIQTRKCISLPPYGFLSIFFSTVCSLLLCWFRNKDSIFRRKPIVVPHVEPVTAINKRHASVRILYVTHRQFGDAKDNVVAQFCW